LDNMTDVSPHTDENDFEPRSLSPVAKLVIILLVVLLVIVLGYPIIVSTIYQWNAPTPVPTPLPLLWETAFSGRLAAIG